MTVAVQMRRDMLEELAMAAAYTLMVGGKEDTDLLRDALKSLYAQLNADKTGAD